MIPKNLIGDNTPSRPGENPLTTPSRSPAGADAPRMDRPAVRKMTRGASACQPRATGYRRVFPRRLVIDGTRRPGRPRSVSGMDRANRRLPENFMPRRAGPGKRDRDGYTRRSAKTPPKGTTAMARLGFALAPALLLLGLASTARAQPTPRPATRRSARSRSAARGAGTSSKSTPPTAGSTSPGATASSSSTSTPRRSSARSPTRRASTGSPSSPTSTAASPATAATPPSRSSTSRR